MHAASRHGTPSLTSLPKDGGVSCFWSFIRKVAHPVSDRTQPCLTSVKLIELAGPLGHSPLLVRPLPSTCMVMGPCASIFKKSASATCAVKIEKGVPDTKHARGQKCTINCVICPTDATCWRSVTANFEPFTLYRIHLVPHS